MSAPRPSQVTVYKITVTYTDGTTEVFNNLDGYGKEDGFLWMMHDDLKRVTEVNLTQIRKFVVEDDTPPAA